MFVIPRFFHLTSTASYGSVKPRNGFKVFGNITASTRIKRLARDERDSISAVGGQKFHVKIGSFLGE